MYKVILSLMKSLKGLLNEPVNSTVLVVPVLPVNVVDQVDNVGVDSVLESKFACVVIDHDGQHHNPTNRVLLLRIID